MTLNSASLNPSKYSKTEVKVKYIIVPILICNFQQTEKIFVRISIFF